MSRGMQAAVLLGLMALTACTPRSLYGTGQIWQRQACNDMEDVRRRSECLASAGASYEQYQLTRR